MTIVATTALPVLVLAPNMNSLLKTFERRNDVRRELANSSHSDNASTRKIARTRQAEAVPEGLDQFRSTRRSAGQLRTDTAACRENDLRTGEWNAYDENRLADDDDMRRRAGGATEVHA